ncbi:hypothetical protein IE077_001871 [Cardiosporidium cionae]|uniref:Uncharacterized protein n=1 Tax=Cardiosporidium cionae TaxID=476202 RepID=A0ABQ7JC16_9APIC|nr:hypothetical protein IE077_001871 [Cardiosporidium cionae]|eukprot:KAF8821556.1 hypothetical protein IE077_001871 [Cardiosporidium cionae]
MEKRMSFPEGLDKIRYPTICKSEPIEEIIKILERNRDTLAKKTDEHGLTALSFAVQRIKEAESLQLLQWLVERFNADVHQLDNHQQNCLFYAAREGHLKCCAYLLECGIHINQVDNCGQTALFYAAREGRTEIVRLLVKRGCPLNQADIVHGETPLFYAAVNGRKETVEAMILELGANAAHLNFVGKTAASMARRINSRSTSLLLEQETKKALSAVECAGIASSMKEVSTKGTGTTACDLHPSVNAFGNGDLKVEGNISPGSQESQHPSSHSNEKRDSIEAKVTEAACGSLILQNQPVLDKNSEFSNPEHSAAKMMGYSKENDNVCNYAVGSESLENTTNLRDEGKISIARADRNGKRCLKRLQNGPLCSAATQLCCQSVSSFFNHLFSIPFLTKTFPKIVVLASFDYIFSIFYRKKYRLQYCEKDGKWKFPTAKKMQEFENRFPDIAIWTKDSQFLALPVSSDISMVLNPYL